MTFICEDDRVLLAVADVIASLSRSHRYVNAGDGRPHPFAWRARQRLADFRRATDYRASRAQSVRVLRSSGGPSGYTLFRLPLPCAARTYGVHDAPDRLVRVHRTRVIGLAFGREVLHPARAREPGRGSLLAPIHIRSGGHRPTSCRPHTRAFRGCGCPSPQLRAGRCSRAEVRTRRRCPTLGRSSHTWQLPPR